MAHTMKDVVCRAAATSEQKALETLQWRSSLSNERYRDALLAHPDAIELPVDQIVAGRVFVAERGGVTLGFAAIVPRDDGATELDGLFVEPDFWRQGIGRLLIDHCASAARGHGSSALHVVANPDAEGFYQSCGFEGTGTVQTRFGAALAMRRSL